MTNSSEDKTPARPVPDTHRFMGRVEFQQQVRDGLRAAADEGWRELWMVDASFEDWPLGERVVAQALHDWSQTGRKMFLLARRYDELQRVHHRFVSWRVQWAHIIEARALPGADASDFPSAIASPKWVLQRVNLEHCTGFVSHDAARRVALAETLRELWSRASPAFAASTLGI